MSNLLSFVGGSALAANMPVEKSLQNWRWIGCDVRDMWEYAHGMNKMELT